MRHDRPDARVADPLTRNTVLGEPAEPAAPLAAPPAGPLCSLEELLLRQALGESPAGWLREACASGVMMIPIPARGVYRGVAGVNDARMVDGVEDVTITAKADQRLVPLPEGASYLGFIFAAGATSASVVQSLRAAHARLRFAVEPELRVLQSADGAM